MRRRLALGLAIMAIAAAAPSSSAAGPAKTALVIPDAEGDANFSGLHGGALPIPSQQNMDLTSVTFDTTKRGRTPVSLRIDLLLPTAPNTLPTASYGVIAEHSVCGQMRLQIYYSESGAETYGDLAACGSNTDPTSTNAEQHAIDFAPKVEGNTLRLEIPLKLMPKEFKFGSSLSGISAYTSTAEFVVAGYQPTDFEPSAGIDTATSDKTWKIA